MLLPKLSKKQASSLVRKQDDKKIHLDGNNETNEEFRTFSEADFD